MRHDIRFDLEFLQVRQENEGSPDEPYLWIQFGAFDATRVNQADPAASTFRFHSISGSHGNLGSASDDVSEGERVDVPARIGRWDTFLETELVLGGRRVDLTDSCFVFAVVIAMEEDGTPDSSAEEARRRLVVELRRQLDENLGGVVRDILGGEDLSTQQIIDRLSELDRDALIDAVRASFEGPVIRTVVLTLIFAPWFVAAALDPDDYVGRDVVVRTLAEILGAGPGGSTFERSIELDAEELAERQRLPNAIGPGRYRLVGRVSERTTAGFIAPAAAGSGDGRRTHLFGRGFDGRVRHCRRESAGGQFGRWATVPLGVLKSAPAAALDADGEDVLLYGLGMDGKLWFARSQDGGDRWHTAWQRVEVGDFISAPAIARGNGGRTIHLVARGTDRRCWYARSLDGGQSWNPLWAPILSGSFRSGLGIACSADGREVHLAGRGDDFQIWRAFSFDGGNSWGGWDKISGIDGGFPSAPAVACSADGTFVHFVARDEERRFRHLLMNRDGGAFVTGWEPRTEGGRFLSSPAAVCDASGRKLLVSGIGFDRRLWAAEFDDFGQRILWGYGPIGDQRLL